MAQAMRMVCAMNAPHLPHFASPARPLGSDWYQAPLTLRNVDVIDEFDAEAPDSVVAQHPVATLAIAVGASLVGGITWVMLFMWLFHQTPTVMLVVPAILAGLAFGLFRWLYHRLS